MVTDTTATAAVDRVLDEFIAGWSTHDMERLLPLFTDDVEYEDVTFGVANHGKEELRAFAEGFFAVSPDVTFELTSKVVTSTRVAAEWVAKGTHQGDLPGMPATGKPWQVRGASVMELADGKITRCADYWYFATMMRQLDFLPEAGSSAS